MLASNFRRGRTVAPVYAQDRHAVVAGVTDSAR
jgi:hypothetical protein